MDGRRRLGGQVRGTKPGTSFPVHLSSRMSQSPVLTQGSNLQSLSIERQFPSDSSMGPATLVQCLNSLLEAQFESVHIQSRVTRRCAERKHPAHSGSFCLTGSPFSASYLPTRAPLHIALELRLDRYLGRVFYESILKFTGELNPALFASSVQPRSVCSVPHVCMNGRSHRRSVFMPLVAYAVGFGIPVLPCHGSESKP